MAALGTRKLTIDIDGDDVTPEVSRAIITAAESDSDFVSFADANAGGSREYTLELTFVQDPEVGSLWDQVWAHAGDEVDVVVRPNGNATASATQPHFEGTVIISEPDGDLLGGEADASASARFVTEAAWKFVSKPSRVVA
jgi:hypothetical protein